MLQIGFKLKPFLCHIFSYKIINLKMLTRVQVNKFVKDNLEDGQFSFLIQSQVKTLLQLGKKNKNFALIMCLQFYKITMIPII